MTRRSLERTERTYHRRIRAWSLYDWANSAFATVVLAAVLPIYYKEVAANTLSTPAKATAFWAISLSASYLIVAVLAPIIGSLADVLRIKKLLLGMFVAIGAIGTGLLFLVRDGDWLLASGLFVVGQVGFWSANIVYDSLLSHVATEADEDKVSATGFAYGYLGGGLLLIGCAGLILALPKDDLGARLAFLMVAAWWVLFSIPVLRRVPEPPAAASKHGVGQSALRASVARLSTTLRNIRQYRQLSRYLLAFLLLETGIGSVIAISVIYSQELGFGQTEALLALILVQFVGIPFTLLFGRLADRGEFRRPLILAFITWTLIGLPIVGILTSRTLPREVVGRPGSDFEATATAIGQGEVPITQAGLTTFPPVPPGTAEAGRPWVEITREEFLSQDNLPADDDYLFTRIPNAALEFRFNGQQIRLFHTTGPNHGIFTAFIDGQPVLEDDEQIEINGYTRAYRFGIPILLDAKQAGEHVLRIQNTAAKDQRSTGNQLAISKVDVLSPVRASKLLSILGLLTVVLLGAGVLASITHKMFEGTASRMDSKRSILLALGGYVGVAVWGYFLDTSMEFWTLAVMVAVIQGGSQALARSLFASMSPASQSGEFFGLFNSMSRLSSVIIPLLFAGAVAVFGESRPAVLSLVVYFVVAGWILWKVDVAEGRQIARYQDAGAVFYPRHIEGGLLNYGRSLGATPVAVEKTAPDTWLTESEKSTASRR